MERLINFYSNRIVNYISTYLPILIVINHFTNSAVICFAALFLFGTLATFTNFDVPLNILFSILGCIWVFTDGYTILVAVLYLIFVIPKLVMLFKAIVSMKK